MTAKRIISSCSIICLLFAVTFGGGAFAAEKQAADEALHAWVIANADGAYYLLDPSWDANSEDGYRYFLIGTEEDAGRHVPGAAFTTESFTKRYPLAKETYDAGDGMSIRDF